MYLLLPTPRIPPATQKAADAAAGCHTFYNIQLVFRKSVTVDGRYSNLCMGIHEKDSLSETVSPPMLTPPARKVLAAYHLSQNRSACATS